MIVAFPGETREEFEESLAFIQKCGFAEMHIFPYSRRPGTPADKMPGQHDNATKEQRSREAIAVGEKLKKAYLESLIGSRQQVLFEQTQDDYFTGYAPNYAKVYVRGEGLHNAVREVVITGQFRDGLMGELA
jgi:threonylcarbamoyladenosine tRNA methylthiotransferase MtaB